MKNYVKPKRSVSLLTILILLLGIVSAMPIDINPKEKNIEIRTVLIQIGCNRAYVTDG